LDFSDCCRNRVKTKVLWTGPLSIVSTPSSLDGSEKFSDWDMIVINMSVTSDSFMSASITSTLVLSVPDSIRSYSDTAFMQFQKLSDTSFELAIKSVTAGNIQRIIGISL